MDGTLVDYSVVGPMAPNREWALDEVSISALSSAGIIQGDLDMDGRSSIKDRDVGEAIGEYFFGFAENPFRESTILSPTGFED
jgi:hypothetical protein